MTSLAFCFPFFSEVVSALEQSGWLMQHAGAQQIFWALPDKRPLSDQFVSGLPYRTGDFLLHSVLAGKFNVVSLTYCLPRLVVCLKFRPHLSLPANLT